MFELRRSQAESLGSNLDLSRVNVSSEELSIRLGRYVDSRLG